MNQPQGPVLADIPPARRRERRTVERRASPLVERIAGWSARYKKTAVAGWLLVAVVFVVGHALGAKSVPSYNPGQSGQAQRTLHQLTGNAFAAPSEIVLIQALAPGQRFSSDAASLPTS
jgi:putative drug exporter of the RND superfamily